MMRLLIRKSLGALIMSAAVGSIAAVPSREAPGPDLEAVKAGFPEVEIRHVEADEEDGIVIQEFELRDGDAGIEVKVGPDGRILKMEAAITAADLPKPVADLVGSLHPGQPILEVEKVIRYDEARESTYYEIDVATEDRKVEMKVAADGTLLDGDEEARDGEGEVPKGAGAGGDPHERREGESPRPLVPVREQVANLVARS